MLFCHVAYQRTDMFINLLFHLFILVDLLFIDLILYLDIPPEKKCNKLLSHTTSITSHHFLILLAQAWAAPKRGVSPPDVLLLRAEGRGEVSRCGCGFSRSTSQG